MKRARIILITMICLLLTTGMFTFYGRKGLSNLYRSTTGVFTAGSFTRLLTYATLSPYRTFYTVATQPTVNVTYLLFTSSSVTWTTIGGTPYYYDVTAGVAWNGPVYDDQDQ